MSKKGKTLVLFGPQGSEMSEMISLIMGIKFAVSLKMGERNYTGLMCKNTMAGCISFEKD